MAANNSAVAVSSIRPIAGPSSASTQKLPNSTSPDNQSLTNLANPRSISFVYDFRGPEVHETCFRVVTPGSDSVR
ncbi:hypothetical protein ACVW1C_008031 [Bradyrhizobium sp. USDA 4011]